ncbi:MAG: Clp protease N-terminal domain-containing protein [Cyanobacteriota bacterium]|nr:Clp protease N-terminal domain-containing protein [Cyanobacteriota bacterium]
MFEKFTEKALNVIVEAQNIAIYDHSDKVLSEHLLLATVKKAKGFCARIFNSYNITYERLSEEIYKTLKINESDMNSSIPFSDDFKRILQSTMNLVNDSGNSTVHYEHLVLALINDTHSKISQYLTNLGFDIEKSRPLIEKLVQRKVKKDFHPEVEENKDVEIDLTKETDTLFDNKESSKVFERAVAKLSTSGYEILGTEQIISSVLEDKESNLSKILAHFGITDEAFEDKLSKVSSRSAEYEGRQIVFTPNAFIAMSLAQQTAKELGSSEVLPEHIILGLLKSKKGVAYNIFEQFGINDDDLAHSIIKPIEKEMPETLTILRLAKQEARALGKNVVGTEMFLLGIIGEATGVGAVVLNELQINIKDARKVVEQLVGVGNDYFDNEIVFTKRAKRVLETAWEIAKKSNKTKIESSDLLWAITTEPTSTAMQALEQLGTDVLEIREGIKKHSR